MAAMTRLCISADKTSNISLISAAKAVIEGLMVSFLGLATIKNEIAIY